MFSKTQSRILYIPVLHAETIDHLFELGCLVLEPWVAEYRDHAKRPRHGPVSKAEWSTI
jgi:hypothetical protein